MRFSRHYSYDTIEIVVYDYLDIMEKDGVISSETLVNLWDWDSTTYQIFLEADSAFTYKEAQILQDYINKTIHKRNLISIIRIQHRPDGQLNPSL